MANDFTLPAGACPNGVLIVLDPTHPAPSEAFTTRILPGKAFGTERYEHDRVLRRSAERLEVGVKSSWVEARFGAQVDILGAVATALVLVLGVLSVADGRITPGDLVVVRKMLDERGLLEPEELEELLHQPAK